MFNIEEFTNFNHINNIVLGVAGFLGSNLLDKLANSGENVICIDNLSMGKFHNINYLESYSNFKNMILLFHCLQKYQLKKFGI